MRYIRIYVFYLIFSSSWPVVLFFLRSSCLGCVSVLMLTRTGCSICHACDMLHLRRDSRKGLLMNEPEISAGSVTVFKDSQLLPKVSEGGVFSSTRTIWLIVVKGRTAVHTSEFASIPLTETGLRIGLFCPSSPVRLSHRFAMDPSTVGINSTYHMCEVCRHETLSDATPQTGSRLGHDQTGVSAFFCRWGWLSFRCRSLPA